MPIYELDGRIPTIDASAFIHPEAVLIGDVRIGKRTSVWPTAVLRGDSSYISIGDETFVGSGSVMKEGIIVGESCVVGMGLSLLTNLDNGQIFLGGVRE